MLIVLPFILPPQYMKFISVINNFYLLVVLVNLDNPFILLSIKHASFSL